mmetsp:Transcript_32056/g.73215  ORF Transcript_32056/g.73215 Transcript_32056/m.73215 type:complete len:825 (-) Transcript_32056:30-2504(-)
MSIPIHFDRGVLIQNWRLSLFYLFLLLVVILADLTKAVFNEIWLRRVAVVGEVQLRAQRNATATSQAWAEFSQSDICTQPESYSYQRQSDSKRTFTSNRCLAPCSSGGEDISIIRHAPDGGLVNCFLDAEAITGIPAATSNVFLPTHVQDATYDARGRNLETAQNYFTPAPEASSVVINYAYTIRSEEVSESSATTTSHDVSTVILRKNDEVYRIVEPGVETVLTVPELLELAGVSLDSIQSGAGANVVADAAFPDGPVTRISGVELQMHVDCYDYLKVVVGATAPLCYLLVENSKMQWVEHTRRIHAGEGGFRQRVSHGIQVTGHIGGEYTEANPNNVYIEFMIFFVYLELPTLVVVIVCGMFVGHVSEIYRRTIWKKFSCVDEVAGTVLRRLMYKCAFKNLADMRSESREATGISKAKMRVYLGELMGLRNHILDDYEMRWMVNFCFRSLSAVRKRAAEPLPPKPGSLLRRCCRKLGIILHEAWVEMKEACNVHRPNVQRYNYNAIDLDAFILACSVPDGMAFNDAVKLFRSKRKIKRLERRFTPLEVKNMLQACSKDDPDETVHALGSNRTLDEEEEIRLAPYTSRIGLTERKCRDIEQAIEEIHEQLQQMEIDDIRELEYNDLGGKGSFARLANKAALHSSKERKKQVQQGLDRLRKEVEALANTGKALQDRSDVVESLKEALAKRVEYSDYRSERHVMQVEDIFDRIAAVEDAQFAQAEDETSTEGGDRSPGSVREYTPGRASLISLSDVAHHGPAHMQGERRRGSTASSTAQDSFTGSDGAPSSTALGDALQVAQGMPLDDEDEPPVGFMLGTALQAV